MGGQIGVRSELGSGSTFWFNMMLREFDARFISGELAPPNNSYGPHVTILAHNPERFTPLIESLEKKGFQAKAFQTGSEALNALRDNVLDRPQQSVVVIDHDAEHIDAHTQLRRFTECQIVQSSRFLVICPPKGSQSQADIPFVGRVYRLEKPASLKDIAEALVGMLKIRQAVTHIDHSIGAKPVKRIASL